MYQPEPLNWKAGDDTSFRNGPPHFGHSVSGGSENFRIVSKRCPQDSQAYSYIGIRLV